LCQNKGTLEVVTDIDTSGNANDDTVGQQVATAISTACQWAAATSAPQTNAAVEDQTTHRPLLGSGVTAVMAGGPYFQKAISYLENSASVSPVYFASANNGTTFSFVRRDTGATIVSTPISALTAQHDFFVIALMTEPESGTLVAAAYGFYQPGTAAAGYYASTSIFTAAKLPTATYRWAVVEWTDKDGDMLPSAADTFNALASE
jgi:hypothetical protein